MSEMTKFPELVPKIGQIIQIKIVMPPKESGNSIETIEEVMVLGRSKNVTCFIIYLSNSNKMCYDSVEEKWVCHWIENIEHTAKIIYTWSDQTAYNQTS